MFLFLFKGVYVEKLSEYFVKSPEEIGRLLKSGKKKLAIAETKMNRQSSRLVQSHIQLKFTTLKKHLRIQISEKTQRFDVTMTSFSSDNNET